MKLQQPAPAVPIRPIVFLLIAILGVSAAGGLGIMWLRQRIAVSATRIRNMETQAAALDRKVRHLDGRIAAVHQPESLRRRGEALGLQLAPPRPGQVFHLPGAPLPTPNLQTVPADEPMLATLDLAFIEPPTRPSAKTATRAPGGAKAAPAVKKQTSSKSTRR